MLLVILEHEIFSALFFTHSHLRTYLLRKAAVLLSASVIRLLLQHFRDLRLRLIGGLLGFRWRGGCPILLVFPGLVAHAQALHEVFVRQAADAVLEASAFALRILELPLDLFLFSITAACSAFSASIFCDNVFVPAVFVSVSGAVALEAAAHVEPVTSGVAGPTAAAPVASSAGATMSASWAGMGLWTRRSLLRQRVVP